ncbi:TPA: hypothetical protein ACFNMY_001775 [Neisseria bacilliformis]
MPDEHRQQKMSGMNARPTESVIAPYLNGERPSEKSAKHVLAAPKLCFQTAFLFFTSKHPSGSKNRVRGLHHTPYLNGKRPSETGIPFFQTACWCAIWNPT